MLERALGSDAQAWAEEFGRDRDVQSLYAERNVFRYLTFPGEIAVRLSEQAPVVDLLRVVAAGLVAGARLRVSTGVELPSSAKAALAGAGVPMRTETDAEFLGAAASLRSGRMRLIGGDSVALARAINGRVDLAVYSGEVTESGRVEMLPFLREQAVSITAHRFGTPNGLTEGLLSR